MIAQQQTIRIRGGFDPPFLLEGADLRGLGLLKKEPLKALVDLK